MKSKKSDIIKNCLKKGIPIAAWVGSIVGLTCGCGDKNAEVKTPEPKPAEKMPVPEIPIPGRLSGAIMPIEKEVKKYTEKLAFNDRDFTKNFSKLSAAGEKKLNSFAENISREYANFFSLNNVIELEFIWGKAGESDANKRKKARTVFKRFAYVYTTTAGIALTPQRIVTSMIATTIDKEFNFRADKSRW